MTIEERDKKVEEIKKELLESYRLKSFWSFGVSVSISKVPSYRKKDKIQEEIILERSNWFFYLLAGISGSFLLYLFCKNSEITVSHYGSSLFILSLFSVYLFIVGYDQFKSVKKIVINRNGIVCDGVVTQWSDIFQIYTVSTPYARWKREFLCIALNNSEIREFEISNWSHNEIEDKLEHYKITYIDAE